MNTYDFFIAIANSSIQGKIVILFIFLCTLGFLSFVLYVLFKLISKFKNIKFGSVQGSTDSPVEEVVVCEEERVHATCPKVKDVVQLLILQSEKNDKIASIKYKRCIDEQMSFVEGQIDLVLQNAEKMICIALEKMEKPYYTISPEYISYYTFLEMFRERLNDKFYRMCKENHLSEKTEKEYAEYLETHAQLIKNMAQTLPKFRYPFHDELKEYTQLDRLANNLYDITFEIGYKIREISIYFEKEVKRLEDDFNEKYKEIIGTI